MYNGNKDLLQQHTTGSKPRIGCVIMACGESRRFQGNKLMERFGEAPMIHSILQLTDSKALFCSRLLITIHPQVQAYCNRHFPNTAVLFQPKPIKRNQVIRLALTALLQDNPDLDGCIFCVSDQPMLRQETLQSMVHSFQQRPDHIIRPCYEEQGGNPILFPREVFDQLLALEEGQGGNTILKNYPPNKLLQIPVQEKMELFDIDTREDLLYSRQKKGQSTYD